MSIKAKRYEHTASIQQRPNTPRPATRSATCTTLSTAPYLHVYKRLRQNPALASGRQEDNGTIHYSPLLTPKHTRGRMTPFSLTQRFCRRNPRACPVRHCTTRFRTGQARIPIRRESHSRGANPQMIRSRTRNTRQTNGP